MKLKLFRAALLICAAIILLTARIHPLTQHGYKKFCEVTNRIPATYLTNICAVASILMFMFGALILIPWRFFGYDFNQQFIKRVYKRLVTDLLSVNLTMAIGYWYLYFYNEELVAGSEGSQYFRANTLLSHFDHTLPPILNISEAYLVGGTFRFSSLLFALGAGILYYTLIATVHYYKKVWPYNLLYNKSYPAVFVIMIVYLMIGTVASLAVLFVFQKIRSSNKNRNRGDLFR